MLSFVIFLSILLAYGVAFTYLERKVAAFAQDRLGPSHVGPYGLLQSVADLTKLLQKEHIIPAKAEKNLFSIAPYLIFLSIFTGFAVMPLSQNVVGSSSAVGLFFLVGFVSLDVVGIVLAGYASHNKYSLLGAMRSAAQIVSYEVPLGLSVLCVALVAESLDLQQIASRQSGDGLLSWFMFSNPLLAVVFVIYFICSLAESNRAPFDLPEAESELVGGFHTEYSGFRWAIIMLSEYALMLLTSLLGAVLFLGGWNAPFWGQMGAWAQSNELWGGFWLLSKAFSLILIQMWVRWTLPRFRADQLMDFGWKWLTPATIAIFLILALAKTL